MKLILINVSLPPPLPPPNDIMIMVNCPLVCMAIAKGVPSQSRVSALSFGYTLCLACILVKMWRVFHIFASPSPKSKVSLHMYVHVYAIVCMCECVCVYCVLCIVCGVWCGGGLWCVYIMCGMCMGDRGMKMIGGLNSIFSKMQLKCVLHDHHVCMHKCTASAKHTQFFDFEFEKTMKNIFL